MKPLSLDDIEQLEKFGMRSFYRKDIDALIHTARLAHKMREALEFYAKRALWYDRLLKAEQSKYELRDVERASHIYQLPSFQEFEDFYHWGIKDEVRTAREIYTWLREYMSQKTGNE